MVVGRPPSRPRGARRILQTTTRPLRCLGSVRPVLACAWVSIPWSPTITTCSIPNRSVTACTAPDNVCWSVMLPLVHSDRDRPTLGRARQPVGDLQLALDRVTRVAAFRERTAAPLHVA